MIRYLGYACQNLSLCEGRKAKDRFFTDRTLRMDRFSIQRVGELGARNAADLLPILKWNVANGIKFFRIGSGMFPFMDHPTLAYRIGDLHAEHEHAIRNSLQEAGEYAKTHGMRLSCHPGPYTCIASPDPQTVAKSVQCLEMHSLIADLLGYGDEFAINIHMGGVYGDKHSTAGRFLKEFSHLHPSIMRRLTLENDDKPTMWSMTELFKGVAKYCTVKLVLDVHHHRFCQQESLREAAEMAFSTWGGFCEIPKVHYSESKEGARPQAHSDYIRNEIPELSDTVTYDVMIEAKAKDLALLEYRKAHTPCLL